jgi:hypothetical protein
MADALANSLSTNSKVLYADFSIKMIVKVIIVTLAQKRNID